MRLQVQIIRHALPSVSILFATSANPSSHTSSKASTISDLLHDVNDLVPLESTDGEWELEDYVVELASTTEGDIETYYECLHYQTLESVLREDDEVLVRCLGSEELRERRRGGRLQITSDGRHLIDGVVFGRKWIKPMADMGRPGITIPPRKRRRLLINEEDAVLPQEEVQAILDENADEDDDYVDGIDEDKENIRPGKSVKMRLTFDDDDDDDDDQDDEYDEDSQDGSFSIDAMEGDELQLLLKDAEELDATERPAETLERQLMTRSSLGKRKRVASEDVTAENEFQGFSTPSRSPAKPRPLVRVAESDIDFESETGSDSEPDFNPDYNTEPDQVAALEDLQHAIVPLDDDSEEYSEDEDDSASTTSSSGTSDSEEDDVASRPPVITDRRSVSNTSKSSSDESDFEDVTSSSGSSSDSSSASDSDESSSSISHIEELAKKPNSSTLKDAANSNTSATQIGNDLSSAPSPVAGTKFSTTTPPGAGQKKTKRNNNRVKKRRMLKALKDQGALDSNANFDDLKAYESGQLEAARQNALANVTLAEEAESVELGLHEDQQTAILEEVESAIPTVQDAELIDTSMQDVRALPSQRVADDVEMDNSLPLELAVPVAAEQQVATEGQNTTPVARLILDERSPRSRLDLAASRRLLFGSLGLRAPKGAAEEQALRDKLAAKASKADKFAKKLEDMQYGQEAVVDPAPAEDSWKQKLIVSAVDCDDGGRQLPPPPFPFEQRWWKNKGKSQGHSRPPHTDEVDQRTRGKVAPAAESGFAPDMSVFDERRESQASNNESRTLSFEIEEDGIPIPTDYVALAPLQPNQILPGAIIAYKELHVSPETNFQPEVSRYRVARVIAHESDDLIRVCLAIKDRDNAHVQGSEASEAAHNPFEVRTDQEEDVMDDGIREMNYSSMLDPKLVDASKIHVPESNPPALGGDCHASPQPNNSAVISESAPIGDSRSGRTPAHVEVDLLEIDTPRRTEITTIIKAAGFDSAMDERLLPSSSVRSSVPPDSSQRSIDDGGVESVTPLNGENAPATASELKARENPNEWRSSPPCLADNDDSGLPVEADSSPSAGLVNTSSPPISPQLTVEYPHMSQLDLDTSMPLYDSNKQSSPIQDAQRLRPPSNANLTFSVSDEQVNVPATDEEPNVMHVNDDDDDDDAAVGSLQSEVPQSSSQPRPDDVFEEASPVHASPCTSSFLETPGYDGQESSYHSSDGSDASDNFGDDFESDGSLPSLRTLTSSQKKKINSKKPLPRPVTSTKKKYEIMEASLSPPPVRRNARRKTRTTSAEDDEDRGSSPPPIKQSQKSPPTRMSQIPVASQLVDLTLSSDPVSRGNSDGEYSSRTQALLSKLSAKKGANGKVKQTNGVVKPRNDVSDSTGMGNSHSKADDVLGTKRFLTQKKSRSQV